MLAACFTTPLPDVTVAVALDSTRIQRVAKFSGRPTAFVTSRPVFATPYTISHAGLIGASRVSMPGEVLLKCHGILFRDELREFKRQVLEMLQ